ncbi:tRNA (adenosine(37)-N6)-threonylcarbamoyltransferase complex dimerization subunit type 1 TsaB [Henriciella mobilis]|uniref:tRNA (Adenosine(37)-N6)-threonylcarbamoyltransferase complex dimerization subunit type 1 TsaB n=1 Tax=Henriciella mobilis TaxID=2305467 RepID=A0A399RFA9_9PROT|nr:tRNA (adenosine(37)-N6)-threonylcarbamoyltransferase complex dimerization subunit type 1 TsaB [Henriciella mobilis]RIJ30068.1 tRNA (adenosine(37)-N6)-threonylcarbamoyltransferase complex dimerization subunit type 1 TsaB [Henriciella mobilis]
MLVLSIDTSGPACDVAIVEDEAVLAEAKDEMVRGQDARLPGLVDETVRAAGVTLSDIDRLAVVTGPGSFTGVRVGISFARGLALALGKPCIGVTSLEAALPTGQQGSAIVLLPAKRRPPDISYWAQRFRSGDAVTEPEEIGLDALAAELKAHPHFVYGDGLVALEDALGGANIHPARPTAARAAVIALRADPDKMKASPVYVRAPDAALPGGKRP